MIVRVQKYRIYKCSNNSSDTSGSCSICIKSLVVTRIGKLEISECCPLWISSNQHLIGYVFERTRGLLLCTCTDRQLSTKASVVNVLIFKSSLFISGSFTQTNKCFMYVVFGEFYIISSLVDVP